MVIKINTQRGFTIVELLIVIVVIGILAAITIVAFNGVQQRAREATVKSDLANVATRMAADNALNGSYPLTAATVNDGAGLPASAGTTYQFQSSGTTYCVTATNGNVSYQTSDSSGGGAIIGGCPGDSVGGTAPIVNMAVNPSFETNTTGWSSTWVATPFARVTSGAGVVNGAAALEINVGTANASGAQYNFSNLQAATTYTASASVTLVSGDKTPFMIGASDGAGTRASQSIASSLLLGQPVRVSLQWTSSATPNGSITFMRNGVSASTAVIRVDSLMITQGSTIYNYADGSSTNWLWNGTSNNSTSKGQPL